MSIKIRVVDLETGPDPSDASNGVIEIGYVDVNARDRDLLGEPTNWYVSDVSWGWFLIDPVLPIPPETSAIHNLIDADVRGKPKWNEVAPKLFDQSNPEHQVVAYAAHSAEHERSIISPELTGDKPWLCTYKIALRLWPESLSHSNGAIRYFLNPEGLDRQRAAPTHRAFPDAYVSAFTLREALNLGHSVDTLAKWSNEPALLPRCKIGDYRNGGKGTPWAEVEGSFLHWILSKDFDTDTVHTVRHELERREIDQRIEREKAELARQFEQNGMSSNPLSEEPSGRPFAPIDAYY